MDLAPMPVPTSAAIEQGVIEVLQNVSRRPIQPAPASDLVADLGFLPAASLPEGQIDEVCAMLYRLWQNAVPGPNSGW